MESSDDEELLPDLSCATEEEEWRELDDEEKESIEAQLEAFLRHEDGLSCIVSPSDERRERIVRWLEYWASGEYWRIAAEAPDAITRPLNFVERDRKEEGPLSPWLSSMKERCGGLHSLTSYEIEIFGAACLQSYAIAHYTGPVSALPPDLYKADIDVLSVCGSPASTLCSSAGLLALARACLVGTSKWSRRWARRAVTMHSRVLTGSSARPKNELWLSEKMDEEGDDEAEAWLERGLSEHYFDQNGRGKNSFVKAQKKANFEIGLVGALGKRTKFQTRSLPQLKLVTSSLEETEGPVVVPTPKLVDLDEDSVLLEKTAFSGAEDDDETKEKTFQSPLQQAIALALCLDVKNSNPEDDGLTVDMMRPYAEAVVAEPLNWMTGSAALLQRCRLERFSAYSADRAALQFQVLVDQHVTTLEDDAPPSSRLQYFYSLEYPAIWEAKSELAQDMVRLGAALSAAKLFEELGDWDSVVECYVASGRRHEALEIIDRQEPTPALLCALGDLNRDEAAYVSAWKLSNERSYRAARSLGKRCAEREEWKEAARWQEAATRVAPNSAAAWFDLGIARIVFEDFSGGASAFSRATACAPEDGDSWANLANCHLRLGRPDRAASALEPALSCRPDDFRLWENSTRVNAKLERVHVLLRGLHRLVDLRPGSQRPVGSFLDQLAVATRLVRQSDNDFSKQSLEKLFLRLDALPFKNADPHLAALYDLRAENAPTPRLRAAARFKATRALFNHPDVWTSDDLVDDLVNSAKTLAENISSELERASTTGDGDDGDKASLSSSASSASHLLVSIASRLQKKDQRPEDSAAAADLSQRALDLARREIQ